MAVVGQFGKLKDTVIPDKGERFNHRWDSPAPVPPATVTQVTSLLVPVSPNTRSFFITKIYVTGRIHCFVELKKAGVLLWAGRSDPSRVDVDVNFQDVELAGAPGETFTLHLEHHHSSSLSFSGNLMGFKR